MLTGAAEAYILRFKDDEAGRAALQFLKLPAGARALSMGGHVITTNPDANTNFWNPAGLALQFDNRYSFTHSEIMSEFRHDYLATAIPLGEIGTVGGAASVLGGLLEGKDIFENDLETNYLDMALGISYGRQFFSDYAFGIKFDFLHSQIDDAQANGFAITVGGLYKFKRDYRAGLSVRNISPGIKYNTSTAFREKLPTSSNIEIGKVTGLDKWSWQVGLESNESDNILYGGGEYMVSPILALRGGYGRAVHSDELGWLSGFTFGAGVNVYGINLDIRIKLMVPIGNHLAISIGYAKKATAEMTEQELLSRANEKFLLRKFKSAKDYALKVLKINPANWEAMSLISRINNELKKRDGEVLSIFYTGNLQSHVGAVLYQGRSLGGLGRRHTKFKELRKLYEHSLFLDAGGVLSLNPEKTYDLLILKALGKMEYDAVNIGPGELISQFKTIRTAKKSFGIPWFNANVTNQKWNSLFQRSKLFKTKKGLRVLVFGALQKGYIPPSMNHKFDASALATSLRHIRVSLKQKPDIEILLLYSSLQTAKQVALATPELDIIVAAEAEKPLDGPIVSGKTLILAPGKWGTHIGNLTISLDDRKKIAGFRNELIALDSKTPSNPDIDSLLSSALIRFSAGQAPDVVKRTPPTIIPYVFSPDSTRGGAIYVKSIHSKVSYRLTSKSVNCHSPQSAHPRPRIAYLCSEPGENQRLFSQSINSRAAIPISDKSDFVHHFSWGPQGIWLYFSQAVDGKSDLFRTTATGDQLENITKGMFGDISHFDISHYNQQLAIQALRHDRDQIWIGNMDMGSPIRITDPSQSGRMPKWSDDGKYLAYTTESSEQPTQEDIYIFFAKENKILKVTHDLNISSYIWSPDNRYLIYSAGLNIMDLNAYEVASGVQKKLVETLDEGIRHETTPIPFPFNGKKGILFESHSASRSHIHWLDLETLEERAIVRLQGFNYLR